jgi:hypothetical protein
LPATSSFIKNSQHFLAKIADLTPNHVIASFDVEALYTNIPNPLSVEAVIEFLAANFEHAKT